MAGPGGLTLGGIPVRIDPSFLLLSVAIGFTAGRGVEGAAVWMVVVGVSILIHELGHALTFRAFGVSSSVLLYAMGGLTVPEHGPRLRAGQDILVSLAGPGVGLAFGAAVAVVAPPGDFPPDSLARLASLYLLYVNIAWGVVNLLPILPLDGGNVLAAILRKTMGDPGVRAVRVVSLVVSAGLGALALAYRQPFLAILALYFGYINLTALRSESGAVRTDPAQEVLVKGVTALETGNLKGAEWAARNVLDRPEASPALRMPAAELLVWTGLACGSLSTATDGRDAAPTGAPVSTLARACLELAGDRTDDGVAMLASGLCEGSTIISNAVVADVVLAAGILDDVVERLCRSSDSPGAAAGLARLQEVLHRSGHHVAAAHVGDRAFAVTGSGIIAFNTACSLALAAREEEALKWLRTAVDAGWNDAEQVERDPDLASVRALPAFAGVRALLTAGADPTTGAPGPGGGAG